MRTILRVSRLATESERPTVTVRVSCTPDALEVSAPAREPVKMAKKAPPKSAMTQEEQEEAQAATKVQSLYRGKRDKQRVQEMKEEKQEKEAATKVQTMYRGKRDRKKVQDLKNSK